MTLEEARNYHKEVLTPVQVSEILGCDPQELRMQARARRDLLGFPTICVGNRVKIPRLAFLAYMDGASVKMGANRG